MPKNLRELAERYSFWDRSMARQEDKGSFSCSGCSGDSCGGLGSGGCGYHSEEDID